LDEAHALSHQIKARIQETLPRAQVLIHVEPPVGKGAVSLDQKCEAENTAGGRGQTLLAENGCQVKRILVAPGQRLSQPASRENPACWIVVNGEAIVVGEPLEKRLRAGDEITLPPGRPCVIQNPGPESLILLQIQIKA